MNIRQKAWGALRKALSVPGKVINKVESGLKRVDQAQEAGNRAIINNLGDTPESYKAKTQGLSPRARKVIETY